MAAAAARSAPSLLAPSLLLLALWLGAAIAIAGATPVTTLRLGSAKGVQVAIDDTFAYNISVRGVPWFVSGPVAMRLPSGRWVAAGADGGGAVSVGTLRRSRGEDSLGTFSCVRTNATAAGGAGSSSTERVEFELAIKAYDRAPAAMFELTLAEPLVMVEANASLRDELLWSFPTLRLQDNATTAAKGWTTWGGNMAWNYGGQPVGAWGKASNIQGGQRGGVPLTTFGNRSGASPAVAAVLSPSSNFMASSQQSWAAGTERFVGLGLMGSVSEAPAGTYSSLLWGGSGLNSAMRGWGRALLQLYGKTTLSHRADDFAVNYLSYYTDAGACYWYDNGRGEQHGYGRPLRSVHAAATAQGSLTAVPFRSLQLDSWWYFQDNNTGLMNWTARPDALPLGLPRLHNDTQWPLILHNRWFSCRTSYAKDNGGAYDFLLEPESMPGAQGAAMPLSQAFWDDLLGNAQREWGLITYEQDWLDVYTDRVLALSSNATLGRTWLKQMGDSAERHGVTVQYCMAYPRHLLQSVEIPVVTHARVTDDYNSHASSDSGSKVVIQQWRVGDTSMLADALGLAPFKDTFRSSGNDQNCSHNHGMGGPFPADTAESFPELQLIVSVLTTGPVGVSDRSGEWDSSALRTACMPDGRLLKADNAATSIDASFAFRAFGSGGPDGEVWSSYTELLPGVAGNLRHWNIFSADLRAAYMLTPAELVGGSTSTMERASEGTARDGREDAESEEAEQEDEGMVDIAELLVYPHGEPEAARPFSASAPLQLTAQMEGFNSTTRSCRSATKTACGYALHHAASRFDNGIALLGEVGKVVPVSRDRISSVSSVSDGSGGGSVTVHLRCVPGETVTMAFWVPSRREARERLGGWIAPAGGGTVKRVDAVIGSDGIGSLVVTS
jgi:hypothetical protein